MAYERLTKRICGAVTVKNDYGSDMSFLNKEARQVSERLAELEDKMEQGLMIEVPCVRERKDYPNQYEAVYEISGFVQSCIVSSVKDGWEIIAYYGEDRAKVEAKKRLKELQE